MTRSALVAIVLLVPAIGAARAEITPGEILFAEMNCVACHDASPELRQRLASRQSPRLGAEGVRLTPQWLRAFLADPVATQPGTLMPDMLHGLPPAQKAEAAEALTHFLVSQQPPAPSKHHGANIGLINEGKRLYHQIGCVQCHTPFDAPAGKELDTAGREELTKLQTASVPMGKLAVKYTVASLSAFLRDPLKSRPSGRMPGMKLSEGEAEAIAMYLLREQVPGGETQQLPGLQYEYYEQDFPELPEFDRLMPTSTGVTSDANIKMAKVRHGFALRFTGTINLPKDGNYKFYTSSDDGTRLYIDGELVVDNGGIHPNQERGSEEMKLNAGPHRFVLTYFQGGGEAVLEARWRGPGFGKQRIPASVFSHDGQPMVPVGDAPFTVDPAKAAKGAELFANLNCTACHTGILREPTRSAPRMATPLADMNPRQPIGCLATKPNPNVPKFDLTDRQRIVILTLLQNQTPLTTALSDDHQVRRAMTVFNCYACHNRDRRGGVDGLRRDYLATIGEVDMGDEGRIPPNLNKVGAKLQSAWLASVLSEGASVRPYMATRMPQFGAKNVEHLVTAFEKADAKPDAQPQPNVFAPGAANDANKFGRKLIGSDGLSCIACHNFAGNPSLGIPALDLATSGQRLKWDWFRSYLIDPQSLRPGTRMPSFWPSGVAANKDILNGDTEKQIAAIWAYLARKNFTDLPAGLVRGKMEIVADTDAKIYRHFIDGSGTRAIGVAYPSRANLSFDANDMRLALIWQGPFIDAAKHRTGRGEGFEKPLGTNLHKLVAGVPFAVLPESGSPWPGEPAAKLGYQFKGYRLDDKQRPAFRYTFGEWQIEDYPVDAPGAVDAFFRRTITVQGPAPAQGQLYFRAAQGAIKQQPDGSFLLDGNVTYRFSNAQPILRNPGDKAELLVPISFEKGRASFVQEIIW